MNNTDTRQSHNRKKSCDSLFDGRLICWQYKKGYRFTVDSVLVAHFPVIQDNETILDLGTGCGIIGLILLYRHRCKPLSIVGVEKQAGLAALAQKNALENNYADQFEVILGDVGKIKRLVKPESFSLVICNPPFYSSGSGRPSVDTETLTARHQPAAGIESFIGAAAYGVKNRGRVALIYPATLLSELLPAMKAKRIEPKRLQFIYPYPESQAGAKIVLVEGMKNGGVGLLVLPPCYIYKEKNGPYSDSLTSMYAAEKQLR